MNIEPRITVMDCFRSVGVERPTPSQSWSVGNRVMRLYVDQFREQPPKDNRPKTSGTGSHCFALYPASWQPMIEKMVRDVISENQIQPRLL